MGLFVSTDEVRKAYREAGLPIFELTRYRWLKLCNSSGLPFPSDLGAFYYDVNIGKVPNVFVVINRTLPNYKKLAVLRHELFHYGCYKRNCHCIANYEDGSCEAHATLSSLLHFIHRREKAPLLFTMETVIRSLFAEGIQRLGAARVVCHPLWKECMDSAGTFFHSWINRHPFVIQRLETLSAAK